MEGVGLGISPVLENAISPLRLLAVREITMVTSSAARDRKGRGRAGRLAGEMGLAGQRKVVTPEDNTGL